MRKQAQALTICKSTAYLSLIKSANSVTSNQYAPYNVLYFPIIDIMGLTINDGRHGENDSVLIIDDGVNGTVPDDGQERFQMAVFLQSNMQNVFFDSCGNFRTLSVYLCVKLQTGYIFAIVCLTCFALKCDN